MKVLRLTISMLLVIVCIFSVSYPLFTIFENASAAGGGEKGSTTTTATPIVTTSPASTQSVAVNVTSTSSTLPPPTVSFISYGVVGGGNISAPPWFTYVNDSVPRTVTLSRTPQLYQIDVGSRWNVEQVITSQLPGERWTLVPGNSTSGIATASMTLIFEYLHQYSLNVTVQPTGAGTTTPSAEEWVNASRVLPVQASPGQGYRFDHWTCQGTGCVPSFQNSITIMMNSPIAIRAYFAQVAGVMIVSLNGNGFLSADNGPPIPLNGTAYVPDWSVNSTHNVEAFSNESCGFSLGAFNGCVYRFQEWLVNGAPPVSGVFVCTSGVCDTYQFTVTGKPTTITAVFRPDYTNLEIASVFTLGIVGIAASLYLWPKKKRATKQQTVMRGFSYQYGYLTDVGKVRSHNEDSVIAMEISATFSSKPTSDLFCAVADGVGGSRKGEVASRIAIQTIMAELLRRVGSAADIGQALKASIEAANSAVANYGMEHRESEGLATTIVASMIDGGTAYVAHVGDSRAYLLNRAEIKQLTRDDSQVQDLIDANQLTPEQARHHPARNVITRAVGGASDVQVSSMSRPLEPGDRIILCSDGLWSAVSDAEIRQIAFQSANPQIACNQLVALANQRGGRDNISVVIVEVKIPDQKLGK